MWSPNPRSTKRSVNSTAAFSRSGYWNSGRYSSISGHWSSGGRLSRVKVSTCADGPSLMLLVMSAGSRSGKGLSRKYDFSHVGSAFVNSQGADFPVERLDRMAGAHAIATMNLHGGINHALRRLCRIEFRHRCLARHACRPRVLGPRGAIDKKRRRVDLDRHVGNVALDHLQFRQWSAEQFAALVSLDVFGERTACEAKRRGPHRGAEDIERGHRDLEAVAGRADEIVDAHTAILEGQAREWMRRHNLDALGDRQPGIVAAHDEGRQTLSACRLAAAGKDHIKIGDPTVRYPCLLAVESETVAAPSRRH